MFTLSETVEGSQKFFNINVIKCSKGENCKIYKLIK